MILRSGDFHLSFTLVFGVLCSPIAILQNPSLDYQLLIFSEASLALRSSASASLPSPPLSSSNSSHVRLWLALERLAYPMSSQFGPSPPGPPPLQLRQRNDIQQHQRARQPLRHQRWQPHHPFFGFDSIRNPSSASLVGSAAAVVGAPGNSRYL